MPAPAASRAGRAGRAGGGVGGRAGGRRQRRGGRLRRRLFLQGQVGLSELATEKASAGSSRSPCRREKLLELIEAVETGSVECEATSARWVAREKRHLDSDGKVAGTAGDTGFGLIPVARLVLGRSPAGAAGLDPIIFPEAALHGSAGGAHRRACHDDAP